MKIVISHDSCDDSCADTDYLVVTMILSTLEWTSSLQVEKYKACVFSIPYIKVPYIGIIQ